MLRGELLEEAGSCTVPELVTPPSQGCGVVDVDAPQSNFLVGG